MANSLRLFSAFERQLKKITKKYPKASKEIDDAIKRLTKDPSKGDIYPGFHPIVVRKVRIKMRSYRLGSSSGLRLIFLYNPEKRVVAPLFIYKKGKPGTEQEVKEKVESALSSIKLELQQTN